MAKYIVYGHEGWVSSVINWVSSVINGELIQCRDCKHLRQGEYGIYCDSMGVYTEKDNFCRWGGTWLD